MSTPPDASNETRDQARFLTDVAEMQRRFWESK